MKKRITIIASIILVFALGLGLSFLLWFRKEINNTGVLRSYRIAAEQSDTEYAELVSRLCKETLNVNLYNATNRSHLYLRMADSKEQALELGFYMDGMPEDSYIITRQGNGLYLLGNSPAALKRSMYYLVNRLCDKDGNLLIKYGDRFLDTKGNTVFYGTDKVRINSFSIDRTKDIPNEAVAKIEYYLAAQADCNKTDSAQADLSILLKVVPETKDKYEIMLNDKELSIVVQSQEYIGEAIDVCANIYFGWMFAGTSGETRVSGEEVLFNSQNGSNGINSTDEKWISEREPIITLWNVNYSRGIYLNDSTSLKTDIMSYSDEQLYSYIRMMKFCGYTGIQVTDICAGWAGVGGYELFQERLRFMANAAHSLGMKFTLWVWGAEFTGYGWVDNSVDYSEGEYDSVRDNPKAVASFDKYYSIYAELADVCDRLIAHYYDPGKLSDSEDVAFFADMLRKKFVAINPQIDFGVSCWVDVFDKSHFVRQLGTDVTFYESCQFSDLDEYDRFRSFCAEFGIRVGIWAWNDGEMEIDQLAAMNFKPHILKDTMLAARKYDSVSKPLYWAEMDSNHVVNIFSLYVAAKLLEDPTQDTDKLTMDIAKSVVGEQYSEAFSDILTLIEDARAGRTYDSFWWSSDDYVLLSDNYDAQNIYDRSRKAMEVLDAIIESDISNNSLPLPVTVTELMKLMKPQVEQIMQFAKFRLSLSMLDKMAADGVSTARLQEYIDELATPVSEYNTVIGLWGQIEARAQQILLKEYSQKYNLVQPVDEVSKFTNKNRIYQYFVSFQKGKDVPNMMGAPYFQYGHAFGSAETIALVEEMIDEGILVKDPVSGLVYLKDWEHYKYAFN